MRNLHKSLFCSFLLLLWLVAVDAYATDWAVEDLALNKCITKEVENKGWKRAADITEIQCNNADIHSIKGIEQFINIEKLSLYKNQLKTADISGLKHLHQLNLAGNEISRLTLQNLPELTELYVFKNNLQALSISNAPKLEKIKANNNQLEAFTVLQVDELSKLYLFDNKLEKLEMKSMPKLEYLDARQNPMPDEFYDLLDTINSLTALHDGNKEDWQ